MNRKAVTTARPSCFPQPVPVSTHVTGRSMSLPSSVCSPFPPTSAPTFPSAGWDLAGGYPHPATQPCLTTPTAPGPLQEAPDPRSLLQNIPIPTEYFHFISKLHLGVDACCLQGGRARGDSALLTDASSDPGILGVSLLFSPPLLTSWVCPLYSPWEFLGSVWDRVAQPWWAARGHCCQTPGTASPCPRIPAWEHGEARGTSIPRLQLIQAAALGSPLEFGLFSLEIQVGGSRVSFCPLQAPGLARE